MILLQTQDLQLDYSMKVQVQLTNKKIKQQTRSLKQIDEQLQKNIKRLLNKQSCIRQQSSTVETSWWLYINPLSSFSLFWYIIYLVIFYMIQLQISLTIGFGPNFLEQQLNFQGAYKPIYIFQLTFLGVDIFLSFFRGYYAYGKGKVVSDSKKILFRYLKTQFYFDLIAFAVYIVPLAQNQFGINFLQFIPAILLWIKKFKYQSQIQLILQYNAGLRAFFLLLVLFIDVLMIGNYGACLFVGIDLLLYRQQYYGTGVNSPYYWLTTNTLYSASLIDGPWYFQYIYGQAFATGTLSTLAPGPFGRNPWQIFYAIFVMVFFMILASYVAEVLIQILYTYTQQRIFHEENIIAFDNLMQMKQVGKSIRNRIYNFFELIWQVELKMETKQQEAMIQKLPNYLKEELLLQIGFTKNLSFLQQLSYGNNLKGMTALKMQRTTIDSNTCIFESNQPISNDQRKIYYIKQGMAKFYLEYTNLNSESANNHSKQKILSLSNVEKLLGVYEFITGQNYSVCCKSIDLCLIQSLKWVDFWGLVTELHLEEQFHQMKHKVLIKKQLKRINKLCVVCLSQHIESECLDLYPKYRLLSGLIDVKSNQNKRNPKKRKNIKSKKQIGVVQQKLSINSLQYFFRDIDIGNLLVQVGKLDKSYEAEFEQITVYRHYFSGHNLEHQDSKR